MRRITKSIIHWTLITAAALPVAMPAPDARACGNVTQAEINAYVRVVKTAEGHLANRKFSLAAINLHTRLGDPRTRHLYFGDVAYSASSRDLTESAVRTMALVTVRTGGAWLYKKQGTYVLAVPDEQSRVANLEWAVESLRMNWLAPRPTFDQELRPRKPGELPLGADPFAEPEPKPSGGLPANPRDASNLAEAMSLLPAHHEEARKILEGLARKDVITSADAYAALARLRAASADEAGAKSALQQCTALGGKRARSICTLDEPRPKVDASLGYGVT